MKPHAECAAAKTRCTICGVSFNIGRIRRPDEPYHAAWAGGENQLLEDDGYYHSFVSRGWERCPASSGCQDVLRPVAPAPKADDDVTDDDVDDDVTDDDVDGDGDDHDDNRASDHDHVPERKEEDEPFKHQSNEDLVGNAEVNEEHSESSAVSDVKHSLEVGDQATRPHVISPRPKDAPEAGNKHPQPKNDGSTDVSPHEDNADNHNGMEDESESLSACSELEHLAGPGCEHCGGYSGFEITAEEMQGCTVAQCLVRKGPDWQPEPDDLDLELSGDYFLSGLIGHMPSTDGGCGPDYTPVRHGCEDLFPEEQSVSHDI